MIRLASRIGTEYKTDMLKSLVELALDDKGIEYGVSMQDAVPAGFEPIDEEDNKVWLDVVIHSTPDVALETLENIDHVFIVTEVDVEDGQGGYDVYGPTEDEGFVLDALEQEYRKINPEHLDQVQEFGRYWE